jgi:hypothetical protein
MKRFLALLCLVAVAIFGIGYFRSAAADKAARGSTPRNNGASASNLNSDKGSTRSSKSLHLTKSENIGTGVEEKDLVKQSAPVAELDAKFANWRSDGRKIVEEMAGGDRQKIGAAFSISMQSEDFRAGFARSRELEAEYRAASDDRKPAIMEELSAIREKGLAVLRQNMNQAPTVPNNGPNVTISGGTLGTPQNGPAPAAPAAPAPPPPAPVFQ